MEVRPGRRRRVELFSWRSWRRTMLEFGLASRSTWDLVRPSLDTTRGSRAETGRRRREIAGEDRRQRAAVSRSRCPRRRPHPAVGHPLGFRGPPGRQKQRPCCRRRMLPSSFSKQSHTAFRGPSCTAWGRRGCTSPLPRVARPDPLRRTKDAC
ncbi:hypothetical protein DFJ74DRAFT_648552 [Hyaloraphidium curvatum]|nr:hypothetical protein DFJ74DRAFT_648552 [Hyaloraphidium curvatum]